jgi:hypothetical protein
MRQDLRLCGLILPAISIFVTPPHNKTVTLDKYASQKVKRPGQRGPGVFSYTRTAATATRAGESRGINRHRGSAPASAITPW